MLARAPWCSFLLAALACSGSGSAPAPARSAVTPAAHSADPPATESPATEAPTEATPAPAEREADSTSDDAEEPRTEGAEATASPSETGAEEDTPAAGTPVRSARVFFIGHSLVNHKMPAMVAQLARAAGLDYDYQVQIINGAPLRWNWEHAAEGEGRNAERGNARAELPSGRFDVVVMTEGVPLDGESIRAGGEFFRLAVASNPATRVYMYETWHGEAWERDYDVYNQYEPNRALHLRGPRGWSWLEALRYMRPAWEQRIDGINAANPRGERMKMVPAGSTLRVLADAIEAGRVPGMTSVRALFDDNIHMNDVGNYFVALVHFATIFRRSPEGLPHALQDEWGRRFTPPTAAQAAALQRIVWEAVSTDPRAGVR